MIIELEYFNGVDWVTKDVELDPAADFSLDPEDIDTEMTRLPGLLQMYCDLSTELRAQASRRKQEVENIYNEEAINLRNTSTERLTDARVKEKTYNSSRYRDAFDSYIEADRVSRKLDGYYKSLYKKADLLIAMCYKQNNELKRMGQF